MVMGRQKGSTSFWLGRKPLSKYIKMISDYPLLGKMVSEENKIKN